MSTKAERRAARESVAAYHQAQLARLVERVGAAIEDFRAGTCDAYDVDEVVFQYSRAARELWKFCNLGNAELVARIIEEGAPSDWWERGARRERRS